MRYVDAHLFRRHGDPGYKDISGNNLDPPRKMERLRQWCQDVNQTRSSVRHTSVKGDCVYVDEVGFKNTGRDRLSI